MIDQQSEPADPATMIDVPVELTRRRFVWRVVCGAALVVPALRALASPEGASADAGLPCEDYRTFCEVTDSFCSEGTFYHWIDCWDIYTYQYCHSFLTAVGCC